MALTSLLAKPVVVGVAGLLVLGGAGAAAADLLSPGFDYELTIVMPTAPNLVPGGKVEVDGTDAGRVSKLESRDGQAMITVGIRDDFAPLPTGTTARIEWKALLGERILVIEPGPAENPDLPDRGRVESSNQRVELDQVLTALDKPTRAKLQSLSARAAQTLRGSEGDFNDTVRTAAPALQALGDIADAVGRDGEALKSLVTRLRDVTSVTTARRADVRSAVADLTALAERTADERGALDRTLSELPATLDQAAGTLERVPATVDAADPLVRDAAPLAAELKGAAGQLRPLLRDLRPTLQNLRPALAGAATVLQDAPGLLDGTHAVLPGLTDVAKGALPAVDFLRPYTPELVGWLSNWGSAAGNYDVYGNYARIWVQAGAASLNESPALIGPTLENFGLVRQSPQRKPGELEGQTWTDANGSGMR